VSQQPPVALSAALSAAAATVTTTTTQPAIAAPSEQVTKTPVMFSGTGGEYFRIWIVNLLLIMITLGIYLPWAKVRKLKYFYNNTRVDEHALEFHGEPKKMLRGMAIVGVLFVVFSWASDVSWAAAVMASVAFLMIAPALFRASMRFRLANTSWRGIRMRFVAQGYREAYACVVIPLAMLLLPSLLMGVFGSGDAKVRQEGMNVMGNAIGVMMMLYAMLLPYFFWRIKRYQHNHYAWGPLTSNYQSGVSATYKTFGMTLLMALLVVMVLAAALYTIVPVLFKGKSSWNGVGGALWVVLPLMLVFLAVINILPRAYFTANMQNLLWSRTGNQHFRFKSELPTAKFIGLQFKNYFLILITLGLYWPFAVVATMRMRLEAISLRTRVDIDSLFDAARARENDAAGDMAADVFGFDVGM
jgi:uncharacterized membrane protein YjgN (DUF898 family)